MSFHEMIHQFYNIIPSHSFAQKYDRVSLIDVDFSQSITS